MLLNFEAHYRATTREEAEQRGLELWREFIQDPDVPLHWSTSFHVESNGDGDDPYDVVMTVKDQPRQ